MGRRGVGHDHVQRGLEASVLDVQRAGEYIDGGNRLGHGFGHGFGHALWLIDTHQILLFPLMRTFPRFPEEKNLAQPSITAAVVGSEVSGSSQWPSDAPG